MIRNAFALFVVLLIGYMHNSELGRIGRCGYFQRKYGLDFKRKRRYSTRNRL